MLIQTRRTLGIVAADMVTLACFLTRTTRELYINVSLQMRCVFRYERSREVERRVNSIVADYVY